MRWSRPADGRGCQRSAHLLHHDPVAPGPRPDQTGPPQPPWPPPVWYRKPHRVLNLTEHATKAARAIRNLGHAVGDHRDRCPRPNHHCRRLVRDSMSLLSDRRAAQGRRHRQVRKRRHELGKKKPRCQPPGRQRPRAPSGHAAAAHPSSVMNSRRFMCCLNPRIAAYHTARCASQQVGLPDVSVGSIMLKKSLMRSVEPSDQLLRAFFRPALRPPFRQDRRV